MSMALKKEITVHKVFTAEYHKVIGLDFDLSRGEDITISVGVYRSKAARDEGEPPTQVSAYWLNGFNFDAEIGVRTHLYELLKLLPEFEGAVDC